MATPTVDKFLTEIARILREKNGVQLQDFLVIEPPFPQLYAVMVSEFHQAFPKGREDALQQKCRHALPDLEDRDDGSSWTAFVKFMGQYFSFIRDVNTEDLVETFELLRSLVKQSVNALSNSTMGVIILPTVIAFSRTLTKLTIALHKKPELIAHLKQRQSSDEGGSRSTLVDTAADVLRDAFSACLNDRTASASGVGPDGKPQGKKISIYVIANLCLKLYFECDKIRSAEQILANIQNGSPPLSLYPASQRVTYLYYLGRYMFLNNHFFRAQLALQAAYDQCHLRCLQQRTRLLPYLITANIILGRFPSRALLARPEASGLDAKFLPLCRAIARGDLTAFRDLLDTPDGPHTDWFVRQRILLPLRNRCEVLVWRSLARKTFLLAGSQGAPGERKAPTFDLQDFVSLARFLEKKALLPPDQRDHANNTAAAARPGSSHTNSIFIFPPSRAPTPPLPSYTDPDLPPPSEETDVSEDQEQPLLPSLSEIEAVLSSLISQGLLNGFISHRQLRFAIRGAKERGALSGGWPNVWEVVSRRETESVPGWKRDEDIVGGGGRGGGVFGGGGGGGAAVGRLGPGMVINLSGARPVGAVGGM
ncbi:MAG: hypothetical protein M1819_003465 [Sarea resinae]|nr:MAG: hypothetical protein M1819_003465 [Sarea resinae]